MKYWKFCNLFKVDKSNWNIIWQKIRSVYLEYLIENNSTLKIKVLFFYWKGTNFRLKLSKKIRQM